jgi:hypothetical protein
MNNADARLEIQMPSGTCRYTVVDVEPHDDGSRKVTVAGEDKLDMLSHAATWIAGEQQVQGTFAPYQVDRSAEPPQYVGIWKAQAAPR